MKKLILAAAITTACAASVFAQGLVVFNNGLSGTISTRVFGPNSAAPTNSYLGNRATDFPAGTATYPAGSLLIGTTGGMTASTTFAQLLGAEGFGMPESSLLPANNPPTSFRTGGASGVIVAQTSTFANIQAGAAAATLEMVAWDNSSGLYGTWAQASIAWRNGLIAAGESGAWNQDKIGGGLVSAPNLVNSTDSAQSLHSFNLYFQAVPEPATAALLGLGAAAMLIFRRRK